MYSSIHRVKIVYMMKRLSRVLVLGVLLVPAAYADECPSCLEWPGASGIEAAISASGISEEELLARLVYAETASTGFPHDPVMYEAISWGVMNRVRLGGASPSMQKAFGKGIHGVVFQKGQFNPALSRGSPFSREFLCPGDPWKWEKAQVAARKAMEGEGNPFISTEWEKRHGLSLVVNFYYPSSVQAQEPYAPWENSTALRFVEEARIGDSVVPPERVRFYRLSRPPGDVTDIRGVR